MNNFNAFKVKNTNHSLFIEGQSEPIDDYLTKRSQSNTKPSLTEVKGPIYNEISEID